MFDWYRLYQLAAWCAKMTERIGAKLRIHTADAGYSSEMVNGTAAAGSRSQLCGSSVVQEGRVVTSLETEG